MILKIPMGFKVIYLIKYIFCINVGGKRGNVNKLCLKKLYLIETCFTKITKIIMQIK